MELVHTVYGPADARRVVISGARSVQQVTDMIHESGVSPSRIRVTGAADPETASPCGPTVSVTNCEDLPLDLYLAGMFAYQHRALATYAMPATHLLYRANRARSLKLPNDANLQEAMGVAKRAACPWDTDMHDQVENHALASRFMDQLTDRMDDRVLVWVCPICGTLSWARDIDGVYLSLEPLCGVTVCASTGLYEKLHFRGPSLVLNAVLRPEYEGVWRDMPHDLFARFAQARVDHQGTALPVITETPARTSNPHFVTHVQKADAYLPMRHSGLPEVTTLRICGLEPTIPLCGRTMRDIFTVTMDALRHADIDWYVTNVVSPDATMAEWDHEVDRESGHFRVDGADVSAFTTHDAVGEVYQIRLRGLRAYREFAEAANQVWHEHYHNKVPAQVTRPLDGRLSVFPASVTCAADVAREVKESFDEAAFREEMHVACAGRNSVPLPATPDKWYIVSCYCPKFRHYASRHPENFDGVGRAFLAAIGMEVSDTSDAARPVFAELVWDDAPARMPAPQFTTTFSTPLRLGQKPSEHPRVPDFVTPTTREECAAAIASAGSLPPVSAFDARDFLGPLSLSKFFGRATRSALMDEFHSPTHHSRSLKHGPTFAEYALVNRLLSLWGFCAKDGTATRVAVEAQEFTPMWIDLFARVCAAGSPACGRARHIAAEFMTTHHTLSATGAFCLLYGWADASSLRRLSHHTVDDVAAQPEGTFNIADTLMPLVFNTDDEWNAEAYALYLIYALRNHAELWQNPNARAAMRKIVDERPASLEYVVDSVETAERVDAARSMRASLRHAVLSTQ